MRVIDAPHRSAGFFHQIGSPEYEALLPPDKRIPGSRAVIGLDVTKVCTVRNFSR